LSSRQEVIIQRAGHPDVALVADEEFSSLRETAYLRRSPKKAGDCWTPSRGLAKVKVRR
jgi:antitoxin YefM